MIKLAFKNLIEKKTQFLLAIISLSIASAAITLFIGVNNGVHNVTFEELEKSSPLNQVTLRPEREQNSLVSFLGGGASISLEEIDEIRELSGVSAVYPQIHFPSISSVEINALGLNLVSDAMIFGVEKGYIENDLLEDNWKIGDPYPVVLPARLLELYNLSIAPSQGLPSLNEEILLGQELTLYPGYSSFFPTNGSRSNRVELRVVGFSDKTNLIGVTLPFEAVQKFQEDLEQTTSGYLEAYVITDDASLTTSVAEQLESKGYETTYFQKSAQDVEAKLNYISIVIGIISVIVFAITAIAIISTFLTRVTEKTKEIGLMRAIGATKKQIKQLIFIESLTIGVIGSAIGTFIAAISTLFIQKFLLERFEDFSTLGSDIIALTPQTIITAMIFTIVLTILASYIPARKAANISPIQAIRT